jgi:hypothetical protein
LSGADGLWPSRTQELLLRSAVGPPDAARASWWEWGAELDIDDIDHASFRLLGLIWRRMEPLGLEHPAAGRIKGAYRQTWVRSNLLVTAVTPMLRSFSDAGIETLLMKGLPIALEYYQDLGARWMADADVLVPLDRLAEAHALLESQGWKSINGDPTEVVTIWQGTPYVNAGGNQIDLHWRALWQPAPDDDFRAAAVPITVGDVETTTLCREDHLLHTCVHGAIREFAPRITWLADAAVLIGDGDLDWQRFIDRARARQTTVASAAVLSYLCERLEVPVPASAIADLRATRAPLAERAAFRAADRPLGTRTASVLWDRYRRFDALGVPGPRPPGFLAYASETLGFERRSELLLAGPRRAGRFVRSRLPKAVGGLGDPDAARGPDAA